MPIWTAPPRKPGLGRIVHYRGRVGRLAVRAAVVTATLDSLIPDGVVAGDVPALDDAMHVHLWVFTPGGGFSEFNVPYSPPRPGGITPGCWCWPPRD
ncbi:hypothetical protein [Actinomadura opuntiae]|uniref:hypothetical protein n=1 Tax=Actinomadura sp. OS1-43 TaxID=604315 RepID=UPI00255B1066|nr:hypothetical protein [Actinomadura sp. OS1-43]MDL4812831.1 hypothetical protein [Actinomadura sp. OS1-43]